MADNLKPVPSKKRKYCVKFNDSWCNKFEFIQKSQKGEGFALCTVFTSDFNVTHGGEKNTNRHKDTSEHKGYVDATEQQRKLTDLYACLTASNLDRNVVKAELLFIWFFGQTTTCLWVLEITLINYSGTCFQILKSWANTDVVSWRQHICWLEQLQSKLLATWKRSCCWLVGTNYQTVMKMINFCQF